MLSCHPFLQVLYMWCSLFFFFSIASDSPCECPVLKAFFLIISLRNFDYLLLIPFRSEVVSQFFLKIPRWPYAPSTSFLTSVEQHIFCLKSTLYATWLSGIPSTNHACVRHMLLELHSQCAMNIYFFFKSESLMIFFNIELYTSNFHFIFYEQNIILLL